MRTYMTLYRSSNLIYKLILILFHSITLLYLKIKFLIVFLYSLKLYYFRRLYYNIIIFGLKIIFDKGLKSTIF